MPTKEERSASLPSAAWRWLLTALSEMVQIQKTRLPFVTPTDSENNAYKLLKETAAVSISCKMY